MASISTKGDELLAGWLNLAAGFNACRSASADPDRRLLTWRAISASDASYFEPPALPIHIVYPTSRLLSAKVRAFIDLVVETAEWKFG